MAAPYRASAGVKAIFGKPDIVVDDALQRSLCSIAASSADVK
ncbi:hypothetical protein [Amycolatopsis sp. NBC_01480]|nr:hypothetical protein [Amycolatopsis sp. NBC_01480]